jgi:hypothetical protein
LFCAAKVIKFSEWAKSRGNRENREDRENKEFREEYH